MKVLIVDDEPGVTIFLSAILKQLWEHRIIVAHNGEEGLLVWGTESPDLVISDWNMPILDGLKMVMRARKFSSVPVIMTTGNGSELGDLINTLPDLNIARIIYKPFTLGKILEAIQDLLPKTTAPP